MGVSRRADMLNQLFRKLNTWRAYAAIWSVIKQTLNEIPSLNISVYDGHEKVERFIILLPSIHPRSVIPRLH